MCHILVALCLLFGCGHEHRHHHMPPQIQPPGSIDFTPIPSKEGFWDFSGVAPFTTPRYPLNDSTPPHGSVRYYTRINLTFAMQITAQNKLGGGAAEDVPDQSFLFNLYRSNQLLYTKELTPSPQLTPVEKEGEKPEDKIGEVTLSEDFITPFKVSPREQLFFSLSGAPTSNETIHLRIDTNRSLVEFVPGVFGTESLPEGTINYQQIWTGQ